MFEESLVESTHALHSRNRGPALIALAIQATLAATIVAIPILHPEVISLATPRLTLFAPPLPRPIPPPPPPQHLLHVETTTSMPTAPSAPTLPPQLSDQMRSNLAPVDAPPLAIGLNLNPAQPNPSTTIIGSSPASPHVVNGSSATTSNSTGKPLHLSTGVLAGLLLAPIRPVYPTIARVSRTEGAVVVQAVISKTGHIESAHVLSGNPMLQQAALDAVRDARYHPFLLNGEPTEVETTITINFRLAS